MKGYRTIFKCITMGPLGTCCLQKDPIVCITRRLKCLADIASYYTTINVFITCTILICTADNDVSLFVTFIILTYFSNIILQVMMCLYLSHLLFSHCTAGYDVSLFITLIILTLYCR